MRKRLIILLGILLVVIATSLLWYTGKIEKYNSRAFGMAFYYSDKYFLEEKVLSDTEKVVILTEDTEENRLVREGKSPGREGPTAITLRVIKLSNSSTTPLEWAKSNVGSNLNLSIGEYHEGKVGQKDSVYYMTDGLYVADNIVVVAKGRAIHISVTYLTPEDRIRKDLAKIIGSIYFYE
mgnify:FL=1